MGCNCMAKGIRLFLSSRAQIMDKFLKRA